MTSEKEPRRTQSIVANDVLDDLEYIRKVLTERTGMKVSTANALRAAIKAWFDVENNG